jgi:1-acyl-sn-glycerol-3-phosphate acyltransferase
VFPEGGIDPEGRMRPFQPGAFRVAMESGRPIVPVVLRGTRHVLEGGFFHVRRGPIGAAVQPPIHTTVRGRAEVARLRDVAQEQMAELLESADVS